MRQDGRREDELRPLLLKRRYLKHTDGSCYIQMGDTWVICSATIEERVPPFLKDTGTGWITAEYSMIPGSTEIRISREHAAGGRSQEIQRMIGRSLRAVVDLSRLGERTIRIDCDVIQADGGTRVASVIGGFVALTEAIYQLRWKKIISRWPLKDWLGAVDVGLVGGKPMLDLNFSEDSQADADMNVVMTSKGEIVEIQVTAERRTIRREDFNALLNLAWRGIEKVIEQLKKELQEIWMDSS